MMLNLLLHTLLSLFRTRGSLALENLALRQQLLVLERTNPKPAARRSTDSESLREGSEVGSEDPLLFNAASQRTAGAQPTSPIA